MAVTIDGTTGVSAVQDGVVQTADLASGAVTSAKLNIGKIGGRRNLIINGAMQIWQRATSHTATSLTYHSVDRYWTYDINGTCQRSTDVPSGEGFLYSMHFDGSTTNAPGSFGQPIELPATGKTMLKSNTDYTISMWVKGDVSGNFDVYHRYRNTKGSGTDNVNIDGGHSDFNVTTSWNRVSATFNTGSTVPHANNTILDIEFSGFNEFTDFYITGIQLEEGSTATPFEHILMLQELDNCRRYYHKQGTTYGFVIAMQTSTSAYGWPSFPVQMRTIPTVVSDHTNINKYVQGAKTTTNLFVQNIREDGWQLHITSTGAAAGDAGHIDAPTLFYTADAEL